jgi:hypothetical protein
MNYFRRISPAPVNAAPKSNETKPDISITWRVRCITKEMSASHEDQAKASHLSPKKRRPIGAGRCQRLHARNHIQTTARASNLAPRALPDICRRRVADDARRHASCDHIFGWVKALSDHPSGPGAAINALVIAMAIIAVLHVPGVLLVALCLPGRASSSRPQPRFFRL